MMATSRHAEEGQAAVFITLLLMFALIALAALAIDGGHLYLVRRDLQNVADAACLAAATELSLHGTQNDAYNAAVEYIEANGGDADLYAPQAGDGVDLVKGIQVSDAEVRVAVQTLVDTYFTRMFNRSQAGVGARAHCSAVAAGGLLPIAVRRYDHNEDETQQLDLMANKTCQPDEDVPATGCYYHDASHYDEHTWNGRYGLMKVHLPKAPYTPADGDVAATPTGNIDCDLPPKDGGYEGVCVLGDGVVTNDGTADFKGFILYDIRNIAAGPVEYHNGATGQADTNKEISKQYFHSGYRGPLPQVGDQLAILDGVSNDFAPQEMSNYWHEGDEFAAIVYSGYVWSRPDAELSIEPVIRGIPFGDDGDPATVSYDVTLEKAGPSPWHADAHFALQAVLAEADDPTDPITPTVDFPAWVTLPEELTQVTFPITVSVTHASDPNTTYLSILTVQAQEMGLGLRRWASANFTYGTVSGDFTVRASAPEFHVPQGGSLDVPLTTRGFGFKKANALVTAAPDEYWPGVFTSSQSDRIRIRDGQDHTSSFTLKVAEYAPLGDYPVTLTVAPAGAPSHSVDIVVNVYQPVPGGEPTRFIVVEGFALFRISHADENTIAAYAIGDIVDDPSEFISGLNPRLLPWVAQ